MMCRGSCLPVFPVVNTGFRRLFLHTLLLCCVGAHGIPELLSPRPMSTQLPRIFGGPREFSTTVTAPPVFQQENNTELHSQVGTTAVLHCTTEHVGENTVSWVRRRDYHLLTVGPVAYSSDQRFSVRYIKSEKDWQLHIRYVQKRDEGVYECQIATHPPISLLSTLHVVEATSEILGGPEKYMTMGSSLRLVCVLRKNTQPPTYVFWYHNDRMINYDTKVKVDTGGEVSVLFLGEVGPQSTGNYSCVPSNAQSSHILVHVLRGGETPAAIHSGSSSATLRSIGHAHPFLFLAASLEYLGNHCKKTPQRFQDRDQIGSSDDVLIRTETRTTASDLSDRATTYNRRVNFRDCEDIKYILPVLDVLEWQQFSKYCDRDVMDSVIAGLKLVFISAVRIIVGISIPLACIALQNFNTKAFLTQANLKLPSLKRKDNELLLKNRPCCDKHVAKEGNSTSFNSDRKSQDLWKGTHNLDPGKSFMITEHACDDLIMTAAMSGDLNQTSKNYFSFTSYVTTIITSSHRKKSR